MKKVQAVILAGVWVFLLTAIGRIIIHMLESVNTIEQGLTMFAFVVFISFLMYCSSILIYNILRGSFGRQ
tara:strand:- start:363 stop:572 length:210 start_codon:yes stop_codon:yes gene_type:complete